MNRRWVLLSLVLLQLGLDMVVIARFPPAGRDFIIQLTAGRVATLDGRRHVFDPGLQALRQSQILGIENNDGRLLPFNHPPLLLPALGPLSRTSPGTAYLIWTAVSVALFLAGTLILTWKMSESATSGLPTAVVRLGILVFYPIAVAVTQGQDTALLFLGVAGFVFLLSRNRDFAAGSALSLAVIRPHIALGLALPFLFARRRVFLGFLIASSILAAYSLSLVGVTGAIQLLELVQRTGFGGDLMIGGSRMPNVLGFLERTADTESRALLATAAWSIWILFVAASSAAWKSLGNRVSILHVGLLICGSIVLAPHIHLHDAALLAIAATICVNWRCQGTRPDWEVPAIALAVASLILTAVSISPSPLYDALLVAAILLIAVPLALDIRRGRSEMDQAGVD